MMTKAIIHIPVDMEEVLEAMKAEIWADQPAWMNGIGTKGEDSHQAPIVQDRHVEVITTATTEEDHLPGTNPATMKADSLLTKMSIQADGRNPVAVTEGV